MTKCFRYLFMFNTPNYAMAAGVAAALLAGCYLTGVPTDGRGLFYGYYNMFPSMLLLVALFSGTAFCSSSLNHALSYGARRGDYFAGMMVLILLNTAIYSLLNALFLSLPELLGWSENFNGVQFSSAFPLSMLTCHAVGCAVGRLYVKSRVWAGVISGVATFFLVLNPIFDTIATHTGNHWGDLPWLLILVSLLVGFVCLFWSYSVIMTATVR